MTYPEVKLVDAPTASATVLFDFNDLTATPAREVLADDFTIGAPELVGDVDAIDPLYGDRTVSFTCRMTGTKPQVAAAQSTLARRLLAPGQGWLRVRVSATSRLLFFRTYRPQPGDLSFDLVQTTSANKVERWELEVDLPCEPFAYGELVTQSTQTVTNDPTSGTNPGRIALPAISGDAPTGIRVRLTPSASMIAPIVYTHLHVAATSQNFVSIPIGTSDGLSLGTDTSAPVTDSTSAGGSHRVVSFATTATTTSRVLGTITARPGRYRMLLRARTSTTDTFAQVAMQNQLTWPTSVVSSVSRWVDMGRYDIAPSRPSDFTGYDNALASSFALLAARTAGAGSLILDHILLLPANLADTDRSSALTLACSFNLDNFTALDFDADAEEAWTSSTGSSVLSGANLPVALSGVFATAVPGQAHNLTVLAATAAGNLATTFGVAISYHPRFLYVGDS